MQTRHDHGLAKLIVHNGYDAAREHVTDGRECWCGPKVIRLARRPKRVRR